VPLSTGDFLHRKAGWLQTYWVGAICERTMERRLANIYRANTAPCNVDNVSKDPEKLHTSSCCSQCHLMQPTTNTAENVGKHNLCRPHALIDTPSNGTVLDTSMPQMYKCTEMDCIHCHYHQDHHQAPLPRPQHRVRRHSSLQHQLDAMQSVSQPQNTDSEQSLVRCGESLWK
jgi:hypothetical protein